MLIFLARAMCEMFGFLKRKPRDVQILMGSQFLKAKEKTP